MKYLIRHNASGLFSSFNDRRGYSWNTINNLQNCFYSQDEANEIIAFYNWDAKPIEYKP